jgi:hypothetical protein
MSIPLWRCPRMLYTCPAWWNNKKCQAKPIGKIQRRALINICTAFRTSPTKALEIEVSISPVKYQIDLIVRRFAARINRLLEDNAIVQRLPEKWRGGKPATRNPPIPTFKETKRKPATTLKKILKYASPDREKIMLFATAPWERTCSKFPGRFKTSPCTVGMDAAKPKSNTSSLSKGTKMTQTYYTSMLMVPKRTYRAFTGLELPQWHTIGGTRLKKVNWV